MTTITLKLPRPHSAQRHILATARRYNVAAMGRRWGKSTLCIELGTRPALAGKPVGYFAPAYKLMVEVWRSMTSALRPVARRINTTERRIELVTGGVIEFWTLDDPDAGRSRRYARAIVDEAGMVKDLGARWNEAIRPTLADYAGDAWFFGTPKGRNYFWELWLKGQNDPLWMSWQMPTERNPYIPPAEVAAMRADLPALVAAQEVDAEFTDGSLNLFRAEDVERAAQPYTVPTAGDYTTAVDVGRRRDATVINTFETSAPPYRRVHFERLERVPFPYIQRRLAEVSERYPGALVVESNGIGDPVIENTDAYIEPFLTTSRSKLNALQSLQLLFERGDIRATWDARERAALLNCAWDDDHTADEVMSLAIFASQVATAGGGWGLA